MADDISKGLILVVLLITIVLSTFGTYVVLQTSTASTTQATIPSGTGRTAITIEPSAEEISQEEVSGNQG